MKNNTVTTYEELKKKTHGESEKVLNLAPCVAIAVDDIPWEDERCGEFYGHSLLLARDRYEMMLKIEVGYCYPEPNRKDKKVFVWEDGEFTCFSALECSYEYMVKEFTGEWGLMNTHKWDKEVKAAALHALEKYCELASLGLAGEFKVEIERSHKFRFPYIGTSRHDNSLDILACRKSYFRSKKR